MPLALQLKFLNVEPLKYLHPKISGYVVSILDIGLSIERCKKLKFILNEYSHIINLLYLLSIIFGSSRNTRQGASRCVTTPKKTILIFVTCRLS